MITVLLLAQLISPSVSDPNTLARLDDQFADTLMKAQRVQEAHLRAHGRYWQGIETPATLPDETTKQKDPNLKVKPSDQADAWEDVFKGTLTLKVKWDGSMRIDTYDGPSGMGWTLTIAVSEGGKRHQRTWNFGAEKWRETGWIVQ